MAGTTLGKRTRSSMEGATSSMPSTRSSKAAIPEPSARTTRSKRKADFVIAADEDENPFVSRKTRKVAHHGDDVEVDELALENTATPKRADSARTSPAQHNAASRRQPLSPKKAVLDQENIEDEIAVSSKPPTPSTPRHRDALSKKVPITPRHRVGLISKATTPSGLRTPSTPHHTGPTVYNIARQAFARGAITDRLVGREKEREELRDFMQSRLEKSKSGCIYVSGPPGTGKSALVNEICDQMEDTTFQRSYVNCMSIKSAKDLSAKILEDFDEMDVLEGSEEKALHQLFAKKNQPHLIILDEVDHLLDVDIELLYQVFAWSMQATSNLVVVGIANALDFTDRFLPKLKSRGLKPQLLPFMPYSVAQISSILTSKLKALLPESTTATPDFIPFLHPTAIMFASKKVAAQTGDLRKAFAIAGRAIDLVETETRAALSKTTADITPSATPSPAKTPLMENMNLSSPVAARSPSKKVQQPSNVLAHLTIETAPRATIAHMARVTAQVFSNGSNQRLAALNLQQKAIMCSLFVLEKRLRDRHDMDVLATPSRANGAPTIKALHAAYTELCKTDNILHALTATEFRDVLMSLQTLSLLSWVNGKSGTFTATAPGTPSRRGRQGGFGMRVAEEKRVASSVGVKELKESLKGPAADILLNLLGGEGL